MIIPTRIVTAPTAEPITLVDVKEHLRGISHNDHDVMLNALIKNAREEAEHRTNRALMPQTIAALYKTWPKNDTFVLPSAPLTSVTSIIYTAADGTETTFASDNYAVDTDSVPGRVVLGYEKVWPTATLHHDEYPIEVTYVAGYANAAAVPQSIKTAMLFIIERLYDRPPDPYLGTIERAIDSLLNAYKVWGF